MDTGEPTVVLWCRRPAALEAALRSAAGESSGVEFVTVAASGDRPETAGEGDCLVADPAVVGVDGIRAAASSGTRTVVCGDPDPELVAEAGGDETVEFLPVPPTPEYADVLVERVCRVATARPRLTVEEWVAALPLAAAVVGPDGQFSAANAAFERVFGLESESLTGAPWQSVFRDEFADVLEAVRDGESWAGIVPERRVTEPGERPTEYYTAFGLGRAVLCIRHAPLSGDRSTATALREGSMLEALLEEVPFSLYFKNRALEHVRASEANTDYHGTDHIETAGGEVVSEPKDLYGKTDRDLYAPAVWKESMRDDKRVVVDGETVTTKDEPVGLPDGHRAWVNTTKVPWYEDGEIRGVIGITMDVTERKQAELRTRRQRDRLAELLERLAADVRGPLSRATAELEALSGAADPDRVERVRRLLTTTETAVEERVSLARRDVLVDPDEGWTLREAVDRARQSLDAPNATVTCTGDLELTVDRTAFRRALTAAFRTFSEHADSDPAVTVGRLHEDGFFLESTSSLPDGLRAVLAGSAPPDPTVDREVDAARFGTVLAAHGWELAAVDSDDGTRLEVTSIV
jgi:PAS domain-containing protein